MEAIVSGLTLPEALRAVEDGLYFSDAAAGGVYRWAKGEVETVIPKRRGVGGLVPHAAGGLVVSGRSLLHVRGAESRLLFEPAGALGLNDLTTDARGRVYVGTLRMDWSRPGEGHAGELWRVDGERRARAVLEGVAYPNGAGFSPDGDRLYLADFVGALVLVAAVRGEPPHAQATLTKLERGNADGLAVDEEGCVWVATGPGGSFDRFDPAGRLVDRLQPPATFAVTLCFGGADGRDLYLATADNTEEPHRRGTIFKLRSAVAGLPIVPASV